MSEDVLDMVQRVRNEVFKKYGNLLDDRKEIDKHSEKQLTYIKSCLLDIIQNDQDEFPKEDYITVKVPGDNDTWKRTYYSEQFLNDMLIAGYRAGYMDAYQGQTDSRKEIIKEISDEIQEKIQEMIKDLD
jgi:hypothetical protein